MTGATPVAATNCLNFGNPEKPEIMAQLSAAIDGIAEACTALGTPITGGNVSLYNETRGEGIYPTPVLGIVGILDDVTKAVPADFQKSGRCDSAAVADPDWRRAQPRICKCPSRERSRSTTTSCRTSRANRRRKAMRKKTSAVTTELSAFGSSEYAKVVLDGIWGQPPPLDLDAEGRPAYAAGGAG